MTGLREYRGRKVLRHLTARFIPQRNSTIPDAICRILLTADTLYVLEDRYDGSYVTHFEIPCGHIERIERYRDTDDGAGIGDNAVVAALALVLGGVITLSAERRVNRKIFMVVLYGKTNEHRCIYFGETEGSIGGFVKAFKKLKTYKM